MTVLKDTAVFDIDGTIANNEHRVHFLQKPEGEKLDWDGFFAAQDKDTLHYGVVQVLDALYTAGTEIILLTGRGKEYEEVTRKWLADNGILFDRLIMRPAGDRTNDDVLKPRQLDDAGLTPERVITIFEDRARIVRSLRKLGYHVCHVAEGEF